MGRKGVLTMFAAFWQVVLHAGAASPLFDSRRVAECRRFAAEKSVPSIQDWQDVGNGRLQLVQPLDVDGVTLEEEGESLNALFDTLADWEARRRQVERTNRVEGPSP